MTATTERETFCGWCGHQRPNPCDRCKKRYESARAFAVENGSRTTPCDYCDRTGWDQIIPEHKVCPKCDGTGIVSAPDSGSEPTP